MIHARGLARTYKTRRGDVDAVRGVDLDVDAGEIVGFLGPNGAGKTTTLRMLTTLLRPTRGEATVAGADLRADPGAVRRRIGQVAPARLRRAVRLGVGRGPGRRGGDRPRPALRRPAVRRRRPRPRAVRPARAG